MPTLGSGERQIDQVIASCLGRKGKLYLTDRRLVFEYSEGVLTKKTNQLGISLADIQAVNAVHGRLGRRDLSITTKDANNGFRTNRITIGIATIPELWMNKINGQLDAISYQPQQQQQTIVEKEVVKVPCKYCGNLIDAFSHNFCPNCGAPVLLDHTS